MDRLGDDETDRLAEDDGLGDRDTDELGDDDGLTDGDGDDERERSDVARKK